MREWLLLGIVLLSAGACGQGRGSDGGAETAELRAMVDTMLPSLARIAALEVRGPVRLERRDSAAVRAYVERQLDQDLPAGSLVAIREVYALLGLLPDTLDLRALMLRLYTEQIVGYYDPAEKTLYVVDGVSPAAVAPVLAHELVHALQDQHADLDSLIGRERGNDRQTAAHAALEGHATLAMFAWLAEQSEQRPLDPATLPNPAASLREGLQAQNEQFPVFRQAPPILQETLLFPYFAGADFVHRLWQSAPAARPAPLGSWLPQSTEQVLHPAERFLVRRDEPTPVAFAAAEGGWTAVGEDDGLGELETAIFLAQHLGQDARTAALGWDGDRYRLLRNPAGELALLWFSVWDDQAAADRFADAVRRAAAALPDRQVQVEQVVRPGLPAVRVLIGRSALPAARELPETCEAEVPICSRTGT